MAIFVERAAVARASYRIAKLTDETSKVPTMSLTARDEVNHAEILSPKVIKNAL